ncbi:MAG: insulinase family protein [Caulobacteraceae bacterium]|nr:insulinase family protein [Caulobacteraceae bacterium]
MRRLFVALAAAMTTGVCGNALAADIRAPIVRYELHVLPNGLKVYSVVDRSRPEVAVQVWYDVGSKDDPPGRAGLAHLFEHLMFKGSPGLPSEYMDEFTESVGGSSNASTTEDYTSYEEVVPAKELERALWAEATRMNALAIDKRSFEVERSVVEEEVREAFADDPYGRLFMQAIPQASFASPALRQSPAGSIHDLQAVTLADVAAFKAHYYRPDNATVIVVGDFEPAQLQAWIERYFGPMKAPPIALPRIARAEPPRRAARRVVIGAHGAPAPAVVLSYAGPAADSPDAAAVRLLDEILTGDGGGLGKAALVERRRIATEVFSDADLRQETGLIYFGAIMAPGHGLGEGEAALRRELGWLKDHRVSRVELATAKAQVLASDLGKRETFGGLAGEIGEAAVVGGNAGEVNSTLGALQAVTPRDIQRVARAYCVDGSRVTIRYGAGGRDRSWLASPPASIAFGASAATLPSAKIPPPPPPSVTLPEFTLPAAVSRTLSNGLHVVIATRPGLPLATALLTFEGGSRLDPAGQPGLTGLAASLALRGSSSRKGHAFAATIAELGLGLTADVGRDSTSLELSGLSPSLPQGLAMLADAVRQPDYAQAELVRALRSRLDDSGEAAEDDIADAALEALVFRRGTARDAAIEPHPITRMDLVRQHDRLWRPDQATLVIAGAVDPESTLAQVQALFGTWPKPTRPPPVSAAEGGERPARVVVLDRPGAALAEVEVGAQATYGSEAARAALELANMTLGGGVSSRLSREIRVRRGLSYDVSSELGLGPGPGLFSVRTETRNATAPEVAGLILAQMRRLAREEMTPAELAARKSELLGDYARRTETTVDLAELIGDEAARGVGVDALAAYPARIEGANPGQVRAAAARLDDPAALDVVIVGDVRRFRGDLGARFPDAKIIGEREPAPLRPKTSHTSFDQQLGSRPRLR